MKYIVYKTTNIINNYIYIGVHKTQNPDVWDHYLGCGSYDNRPSSYQKAKTCFQQALKQYGVKNFTRETLSSYDTPEEAYLVEKLLVNDDFLARPDVYNMIRGGIINNVKGKKVFKYSAESGEFIEKFNSIEDAARDVEVNSSSVFNSIKYKFQIHGFVYSFKHFDVLDLSGYNFKEKQIVYRYLNTGEYDCKFESLTDAGKHTLDTAAAYIQKAAILGYLVKDLYYFSFYKCESYDKARTIAIKNRPVYKYDKDGSFIEGYDKQELAEMNNSGCNITKAIKLRSKDKNDHYWSLEKLQKFNVPVKRTSKKVAKVDFDGNILQIWNSSNACAKEVGTAVKNVLRGEYELHKGFKYKYIDN